MTAPEFTTATGVGAGAWTLLLTVAALAFLSAARARKKMRRQTRELARRAEQLRLLNHVSFALARETTRRGVARTATALLVEEMNAGRAIFWRPDSEGEPEGPWLSWPDDADGPPLLPEAQRIILARTAGRGSVPLLLCDEWEDRRPQPLNVAAAPESGFTLYVPLAGSPREGVLEIYSGSEPWGPGRWELLSPLTVEFTSALRRARHYDEIQERADIDFVTGLYNHRFMQVYLQRLVSTESSPERFALILMDVDNFKAFNDTYGHSVGDRVLQVVADKLKLMTEGVGIVGRFGGDEFIVILSGHSREDALAFSQAFQDWLTNHTLRTPGGHTVPIFVSCGLAAFPEDGSRRQELLAVADARLYECKRASLHVVDALRREGGGDRGLGVFGLLDSLVSSIDRKDNYTRAQSETAAEYAVMLAQRIGLSPSALRTLRLAALLHDVGKICIPDDILRKRGELTAEEFAVIRHHVSIAEELIVDVPNAEEVREIARHHHERFDGRGYPDGLRGEEIPLLARILALADAFSAMTLDRPYRKGLAHDEAFAELQRVAGAQLDPELVREFGRAIAEEEEEQAVPATIDLAR